MIDKKEFDRFADEYSDIHRKNIGFIGETPDYFAEYKIRDVMRIAAGNSLDGGDLKILDFGCGVGNSIRYFLDLFKNSTVHGIDVSEKSVDVAIGRFGDRAIITCYDGNDLPYADDTFDVIFTSCVFHHIDHQYHGSIFAEIKRVLRPGGIFVIFEHNPLNPLTQRAVNTCPFDENAVLIQCGALKKSLAEAGLKVGSYAYRVFFPGVLGFMRFLEPYLWWLPLGGQYYVVAKK